MTAPSPRDCKDCAGKGRRYVPNKRERGMPMLDRGPAFYIICPTCNGDGLSSEGRHLRMVEREMMHSKQVSR